MEPWIENWKRFDDFFKEKHTVYALINMNSVKIVEYH